MENSYQVPFPAHWLLLEITCSICPGRDAHVVARWREVSTVLHNLRRTIKSFRRLLMTRSERTSEVGMHEQTDFVELCRIRYTSRTFFGHKVRRTTIACKHLRPLTLLFMCFSEPVFMCFSFVFGPSDALI